MLISIPARAHDVISTKITWSREISRLMYERCLSCHHTPGGSAFALSTYEEVRPWAKAIKEEVLSRRMPPWGAIKGFGQFQHDPSLSQEEISLFGQWVEGGAPEGDPALLPPVPAHYAAPSGPPRNSHAIRISSSDWIAPRDLRLTAIQPEAGLRQAKVIAERPDSTLIPLLWVYAYPVRWGPVFTFRETILLPKGTRLLTRGSGPAKLTLWIADSPLTTKPAPGP